MIKYILTDIESPDNHHIAQLTECASGKTIKARISGGESNVRAIMYEWESAEGWKDAEIFYFSIREMKNREFNALWKSLNVQLCTREDLQNYFKAEFSK